MNLKIKAGVLLYALLMLLSFALVLEYSYQSLLQEQKLVQEMIQSEEAYFMATFVHHQLGPKDKKGRVMLDKGEVRYQTQGNRINLTVVTTENEQYQYEFPIIEQSR